MGGTSTVTPISAPAPASAATPATPSFNLGIGLSDPISLNVQAICAAFTAGANATTEVLRFLQTPPGQKLLEMAMSGEQQAQEDLAKFFGGIKSVGSSVGGWFEKLFTGKLGK